MFYFRSTILPLLAAFALVEVSLEEPFSSNSPATPVCEARRLRRKTQLSMGKKLALKSDDIEGTMKTLGSCTILTQIAAFGVYVGFGFRILNEYAHPSTPGSTLCGETKAWEALKSLLITLCVVTPPVLLYTLVTFFSFGADRGCCAECAEPCIRRFCYLPTAVPGTFGVFALSIWLLVEVIRGSILCPSFLRTDVFIFAVVTLALGAWGSVKDLFSQCVQKRRANADADSDSSDDDFDDFSDDEFKLRKQRKKNNGAQARKTLRKKKKGKQGRIPSARVRPIRGPDPRAIHSGEQVVTTQTVSRRENGDIVVVAQREVRSRTGVQRETRQQVYAAQQGYGQPAPAGGYYGAQQGYGQPAPAGGYGAAAPGAAGVAAGGYYDANAYGAQAGYGAAPAAAGGQQQYAGYREPRHEHQTETVAAAAAYET